MNFNKKKLIVRALVFLILLAVGYIFVNSDKKEDLRIDAKNLAIQEKSVEFPVQSIKIKKSDLIRNIKTSGIVKAFSEADIISQINGRIVKSYITEGSFVKKNQVLLELDDREMSLELSKAENDLMKAQLEYLVLKIGEDSTKRIVKKDDRIKLLGEKFIEAKKRYEKDEISQDEYMKIRNNYELALISTGEKKDAALQSRSGLLSALNEMKRAELNMSYTKIKAPFSGMIANYDLSMGAYINSAKIICKLVDMSKLKLVVNVVESDIGMLHLGRLADVNIPALGDKRIKGKIMAISPVVDSEKKTCKVEIELPNTDLQIKPGMYASSQIEGEILSNRLVIPKKALLVRQNRKLVFVVNGNKAEWRYVTTGAENDDSIEILNGLTEGDELIVEGHYTLSHDALIKIINKNNESDN
ncbi:MAG TPA: efflux RND transporter periplasmic adaptor subunit [Victivallales bacterium]|nr:efflux RND transporter periplasmic adaptor subunit [Victivallales bacterium]